MTVLVLAAGCGGDDETASTPSESPTASSTSPSASPSETPSTSSGLGGTAAPTDTATPTPEPTATEPTTPSEPSPEPPGGGPPTTYGEALALVAASSQLEELSRFASPTGNLYCVLDSPFVPPSCELGRGAIADPAACPADGPSQSVGRIEFTDVAPQPVCNSDTIREPGAPTLGYGAAATWPGTSVVCLMEEFGVTCVDPDAEQGYVLARGRYQVF